MRQTFASRLVFLAISLFLLVSLAVAPLASLHAQATLNEDSNAGAYTERANAQGRVQPYRSRPSSEALAWANQQLRRMSLDEKIGQLISIGVSATFFNQDSDAYRALRHQIEDNHVGGITLFHGQVYESVLLVNRMQRLARYPLLVSADMEFGAAMRFDDTVSIPWNMAVAATGDERYARRQGEVIASEARALGIRQVFGPVVDVNNNSLNPVINVRSYSEDPTEVARFGTAFIEGAQSKGVIATAKHFPGHGDTVTDSHRGLPIINVGRERLDRMEMIPFRAAIAAGVGSIMTSYIGLPQIDPTPIKPIPRNVRRMPPDGTQVSEIISENATLPAALSPTILNGLLRKELNFDGLVVTDALDMSGLTIYFNQDEAAVRSIEAGADILVKPSDPDAVVRGLRQAVQSRRISEQRIEQSARRILAAKYDLGLVSQPITPLDQVDKLLSNQETVAFAQEVANHAITLVRNDANLLPLGKLKSNGSILNLAITNGEDRLSIATPFDAALKRAGRRVTTVVLDERSSDAEIQRSLELAQSAGTVIVSLYGRVRSGETLSIGLPEPGVRALKNLLERNPELVGISFGNPYLLQNFPALQTYIVAYGDMPSLQEAAARALLGEISFSGRLPITLNKRYPRGTGIQLKASKPS